MNKFICISTIGMILFFLSACKKDLDKVATSYTMVVVNSAVDVPGIQVNPASTTSKIIYTTTPQVTYGNRGIYYVQTGQPVTIVAAADTNKYLVNKAFDITNGVTTMYIAGQSLAIDTIFRQEINFPFIRTDIINSSSDSVVNVRFINLSPNSVPVKIKITSASTNEIDNLPYKGITNWKAYPALLATTSYSFQVRDAATDALLTTYTFAATATNRFKNVMLAIKGLQGTTSGTNAYGVFVVNYF